MDDAEKGQAPFTPSASQRAFAPKGVAGRTHSARSTCGHSDEHSAAGLTDIVTRYSHMLVRPAVGQRVTAGHIIGYVGSSGHSSGPHLRRRPA